MGNDVRGMMYEGRSIFGSLFWENNNCTNQANGVKEE